MPVHIGHGDPKISGAPPAPGAEPWFVEGRSQCGNPVIRVDLHLKSFHKIRGEEFEKYNKIAKCNKDLHLTYIFALKPLANTQTTNIF